MMDNKYKQDCGQNIALSSVAIVGFRWVINMCILPLQSKITLHR